jgi:hypothetical protein
VRYGLAKAEGVAEIASVSGFVKQYNVVIDPQRLRSFDIPLSKVRDAIRASNMDVGGRTVELSEFEYVVRGRGYLKGIPDLQNIVLKNDGGTPVLIQDVARVELGPDERRGLTELNGDGEVASGIVLQRFGANALDVIDNVKKRIGEIAGSLPNCFLRLLTPAIEQLQQCALVDRKLLQRLALDARHDAGNEPARQTHFDHCDQCAVLFQDDTGLVQVVRLLHWGHHRFTSATMDAISSPPPHSISKMPMRRPSFFRAQFDHN